MYTHSNATLKLSVFFPPLYPSESRHADVVVSTSAGATQTTYVRSCDIAEHIWVCSVRIDHLPEDVEYSYVVSYQPDVTIMKNGVYNYGGNIPAQPVESKGYPRVAALGCFGKDSTRDRTDFVQAVLSEKPDLVVVQGDVSYNKSQVAYDFLEFAFSVRDLTRDRPTLMQMDDHDYGEPNLWGADVGDEMSGSGFSKPPCIVNAYQRLFMSHMPDPAVDWTLINGITIHYTTYKWGNVEFAVLESRKFKNIRQGESLLGTEQEDWLDEWCSNDDDNDNQQQPPLKVVLTQTPFADISTSETNMKHQGMYENDDPAVDSNGYPASGRQRFFDIVDGCSSLILSGDQHLGIAVQYEQYGKI